MLRRTGWRWLFAVPFAIACQGQPAPDVEDLAIDPIQDEMAQHDAADHADTDHEGQTLRTIMQQLSVEMAGLSQALWMEDYTAMTRHAMAIAEHPHMLPEEIDRIAGTLGAEMPAFEAADEAVHESAVQLHEAVEGQRLDELVSTLGEVQEGCVSCHTRFRDRLRTDQL